MKKIATNKINTTLAKKVIFIEIFGFTAVLIIIWLNEVLDLSHLLFGFESTPANYDELYLETFLIIFLASFITYVLVKLLKKLKYFEGFLLVCAFCKRIKVNGEWIPIDDFLHDNSKIEISHGYCPKCMKDNFPELNDT